MSSFKSDKEKGSVLVMAVVLSFAMFVMGLSFLASVDTFEKAISREVSETQSIYTGQTDNIIKVTQVKRGDIYPTSMGEWTPFYLQNWYRSQVSFTNNLDDGLFLSTARGYYVVSNGRSTFYGSDIMFETTVTTYQIQETFADYLYITDKERDPVRNEIIRFWTPDTLDGKVHSNDTLHIMGSPRFMKKVTSSASYIDPPNNQAQFDEDFYPNADKIFFPDQADDIRNLSYKRNFGTFAPDSVDSFTELTFNGRNIHVRYCGPYVEEIDTVLKCLPPYISAPAEIFQVPDAIGALFVHGKLIIKANRDNPDILDTNFYSDGFEGRLTVASSDTMIIWDNLIYKYANADNSVPTDIDDVLGLISENFIMVGDGVGDTVYINAAMAAINGSISVRDIYDYGYGPPNNNEKSSLFIFGSLAQRNRGIVHTSHGNWGVRGFRQKDYFYDTRLQKDPPPHFIKVRENNVIYFEN